MTGPLPAISSIGLVTSVGLSAPSSCAAIRAGLTNHTETAYLDSAGELVVAAQVELPLPWRGIAKLKRMLLTAAEECLATRPDVDWSRLPVLLCLSESGRPGRHANLDRELIDSIECDLQPDVTRTAGVEVIAEGRAGIVLAIARARDLLSSGAAPHILIAACDSLVNAGTVAAFDAERRLLTPLNPNGFIPGEAAAVVLMSTADRRPPGSMVCIGIGMTRETAPIGADEPLRGEGLTDAIERALADAGCAMHDVDFRISDVSGEHYYFKEGALALTRTLKRRRERFDWWHPADCIGEVGAAAGLTSLAVAAIAATKGYSPGPTVLLHVGSDSGLRGAAILRST